MMDDRDDLTGLPGYETIWSAVRSATGARRSPASLVLLDVDSLSKKNSLDGTASGDAIVASLGRLLGDVVRPFGIAARLYGDIFSAFLPNLDGSTTAGLTEALISSWREFESGCTFSLGHASFPDDCEDADGLFLAAEVALEAAKTSGGDCVSAHRTDLCPRSSAYVSRRLPCRDFFGRFMELQSILNSLTDNPNNQHVFVGEAGAGKTRLLQVARDHLTSAGFFAVTAYVHSLGSEDPLTPFSTAVRELSRRDSQVAADIAAAVGPASAAKLLSASLHTPSGAVEPSVLCAAITAVSSRKPFVMLVDDCDHLDSGASDFFSELFSELGSGPISFVGTASTDVWSGFDVLSEAEVHELSPLDLEDAAKMLWSIVRLRDLEAFGAKLVSTSRGLPGRLEDIVARLMLEGTLSRNPDGWSVGSVDWDALGGTTEEEFVSARCAELPVWAGRMLTPALSASVSVDARAVSAAARCNTGHARGAIEEAVRLLLLVPDGARRWIARGGAVLEALAGAPYETAPEPTDYGLQRDLDVWDEARPAEIKVEPVAEEKGGFFDADSIVVDRVPSEMEHPIVVPPETAGGQGTESDSELYGGLESKIVEPPSGGTDEQIAVTHMHLDETTGVIRETETFAEKSQVRSVDLGAPGDERPMSEEMISQGFRAVGRMRLVLHNLRYFRSGSPPLLRSAKQVIDDIEPLFSFSERIAFRLEEEGFTLNGSPPRKAISGDVQFFEDTLRALNLKTFALGAGIEIEDLLSLATILNERRDDPPESSTWMKILAARGVRRVELVGIETYGEAVGKAGEHTSTEKEQETGSTSTIDEALDDWLGVVSAIEQTKTVQPDAQDSTVPIESVPPLNVESAARKEDKTDDMELTSYSEFLSGEEEESSESSAVEDGTTEVVESVEAEPVEVRSAVPSSDIDTEVAQSSPVDRAMHGTEKRLPGSALVDVLTALRQMKVTLQNVKLFSPTAKIVVASIERIVSVMQSPFEASELLSVRLVDAGISINDVVPSQQDEPVAAEVALFLESLGADAITFSRGLTTDELSRFLGLVASSGTTPAHPGESRGEDSCPHVMVSLRSGGARVQPPPPPPAAAEGTSPALRTESSIPVQGMNGTAISVIGRKRDELDSLIGRVALEDPKAFEDIDTFLARSGESVVAQIVMAMATTDDESFREAAAAVFDRAAKGDSRLVLETLKSTGSSREKSRLASVLHRWDTPEIHGELIDLLRFPDPGVRRAAEETLSRMTGEGLNDLLEELISPEDDLLAAGCISVLKRRGYGQVIHKAAPILGRKAGWSPERNPATFRTVVAVVGALCHKPSALLLVDLLKTIDDERLVAACIWALGSLGSKSAIETLEGFVNDPRPNISRSAETALSKIEESSQPESEPTGEG
jgi:GGDEF domain-containing protein